MSTLAPAAEFGHLSSRSRTPSPSLSSGSGITAFLAGASSIREVIAFPKTQKATCPLTDAPSEVDQKQLKELHIKLDLPK